jgi:putative (di)nucleoside polyphosphate hydrolase
LPRILPQGGINKGESELEALFRELNEEIGLLPKHGDLVAKTPKWLRYDLPKQHIFFYCKAQKPSGKLYV